METQLEKYIDNILSEGLEKSYWFMTKQTMSDFYFLFFISQIAETYESKHRSGENFGAYYSRCFRENAYMCGKYPTQAASENTYRNIIIAEFFGLCYRERGGYDSSIGADSYKVLKKYIKNEKDEQKYKFLFDRQIEKLCLNINDKAEKYHDVKDINIFPVIFIYKILYELQNEYSDSKLNYDEFLLFCVRAKQYSDWKDVMTLIRNYRSKPLSSEYKNKIATIINDQTMTNIRYDALLGNMNSIFYSTEKGNRFYRIVDDGNSLKYIKNALDLFEHSDYVDCVDKKVLLDFIRSDKYFIGDLDSFATVVEEKEDQEEEKMNLEKPNNNTNMLGTNIILYGVPGCGKSHTIKCEYCDNSAYMQRVVFHPDYTYSDFIGQILPIVTKLENGTESISYDFVPGPFTVALKAAVNDEDNMYYLVIEEINRGNAPAIFGEVFQLLDRENGESEYGITNFSIAEKVYGDKNHEVKIPRNLTILATMNTADQNVFTLDTAFKRRWIMRSIKNDIANCEHANDYICETNVTWYNFATKINDTIIDISDGNLSSEDNRLGAYFVKPDDLKSRKSFGEKVLMYLWNDAFKYDRDVIFSAEYKTLEDLLSAFEDKGFVVFNSSLGFDNAIIYNGSTTSVEEYLANKNQELVELYSKLEEMIVDIIPNTNIYTTPSKQYIGIGSNDNKKKSFVEVIIKMDSLLLEIEKPRKIELQNLGSEIEYNGSHDHYFKIIVKADSDLDAVLEAVVDSYEQLKG